MDQINQNDQGDDSTNGFTVASSSRVTADSGLSSRKLWFGIGTSAAIVLGGIFYAFVEGFRTGYETYIGGLMGVLALYVGGNVANKHIVSKHLVNQAVAIGNIQATSKSEPKAPIEPLPPNDE